MRKKIAFVVQRYGLEVNGGAELHCRQLVEHLSPYFDIEVLTTKAIDYVTWKNQYEEDEMVIHGIPVKRFKVARERKIEKFNKLLDEIVLEGRTSRRKELKFMKLQGPYSPDLIEYLEKSREKYDLFVFFTYLYYTTFVGLPKVAQKAILIPTAHDEPTIYMSIFKEFFKLPKGIFYNTREEKEFVEKMFSNQDIVNNDGLGGVGVDIPDDISSERFKKKYTLDEYVIYIGRIDEAKGCKELFEFWDKYKKRNSNRMKLVLMGKEVMDVPEREDIIKLGFVSDKDKFDGIAGAKVLILPSQFESLSMVVLEAMSLKRPVIVNGHCEVLKGHCVKGNGGLYYMNYLEFEGCLNYLLNNEKKARDMGECGAEYVVENYHWDIIVERFRNMVRRIEE